MKTIRLEKFFWAWIAPHLIRYAFSESWWPMDEKVGSQDSVKHCAPVESGLSLHYESSDSISTGAQCTWLGFNQ